MTQATVLFDENESIDRVIKSRRSVRSFTDTVPDRTLIEQVIEAGRLAPYAGLANKGTTDFRRFFVIARTSEKIEEIRALVLSAVKAKLALLEEKTDPKMENMVKVMRMMAEKGLPLWGAPYLVLIAERRGFPPRENESLAHCLQNMWLKATALGLSMQLVSAICDLNDSSEFGEMLGLPQSEFSYNACMIGYSDEPDRVAPRHEPQSDIKWME